MAHVDAGKTTVTEAFLYHSGVKRRMGRVDDGTATTDSMALEKQRGITIRASTVSFPWNGAKINLIDTPGHMEFIAEVERSLSVLDGVVLVLSAKEGVQPQTRVIFEKLRAMRVPTILFINKIDRVGVSLDRVLDEIRGKLTPRAVPLQAISGEGTRGIAVADLDYATGALHEAIVEASDTLLTAYLNDEPVSGEDCLRALRDETRRCALFPVLFGSALHDVGVVPLMNAVAACFAGHGDAGAPLSGAVYKVEWDEAGRKRHYVRIFDGVLAVRDRVPVVGKEDLQVKALLALRNGQEVHVDTLCAGDIGILLDAPLLRCGDALGTDARVRPPETPPLLTVAVAPGNPAERPALLDALGRLDEEDPFLRVRIDPETAEIKLRLFGALQREVLEALLLERFGLRAVFSPLQTLFKAQPLREASAEIRIWKPGNLHQAGIALTVRPLPEGSGVAYRTLVSFGDLLKPFQNGVAEGVRAGLADGFGEEIVDTEVLFTDMDFSSVTSTPADYRRLAPAVVRAALENAGLRRLEPWLSFAAVAPVGAVKGIVSAIVKRGATIGEVTFGVSEGVVRGEAPLDRIKDFALEFTALTQGSGMFTTEFLAYRER